VTRPRSPFAPFSTLGRLARGRLPGQVVIQFTERCNAACAQCGMRRGNEFARSTLDVGAVRRLLDVLAARGVVSVSFTGGEPLLFLDEVCALAAHARAAGIPFTRTGTNGYLFMGSDKPGFARRIHALAEKLVTAGLYTFWISLDSADPAIHEANRGLPGMVRGLAKALPIFHEHGLHPAVNLGLNRLTGGQRLPAIDPARPKTREAFAAQARLALHRFYLRALDLGFTIVNACYPMSGQDAGAVYQATSRDDVISFSRAEKHELFAALYDVVSRYRHRLRIFTPKSALLALMRETAGEGGPAASACRGGVDFFFVDAKGMRAFPCGYRGGEDLGPALELDPARITPSAACRACEWECFRDPSEMAGPLLDLFRRPLTLVGRLTGDRAFTREWLTDLAYYRACGWFDARIPPDREALARFAPA